MKDDSEVLRKRIAYKMRKFTTCALFNNLVEWAEQDIEANEEVKKALSILDSVFLDDYKDDFVKVLKKGEKFYRARVISTENYDKPEQGIAYSKDRLYGFNAINSKEPPKEKAQDMRNSSSGVVALYLASDEITACTEVRPEIRQFVSIAEFELVDDIIILDFSKKKYQTPLNMFDEKYNADIRHFLSQILFLFTQPAYSYEENRYKVTQKIIEHYKTKGYNGFEYNSFYTGGKNYTFFDEMMKKFKWIDSRVVLNYASANLFIDIDKGIQQNDLCSIKNIQQNVSQEVREKLWENIVKALEYKET